MSALQEVYIQIKQKLSAYNKVKFFKDIIPKELKAAALSDPSTINKYINGHMSAEIIKFYGNIRNKETIKRHLAGFCENVVSGKTKQESANTPEVTEAILELAFVKKSRGLSKRLRDSVKDPEEFFYQLFYYCIAVEMKGLRTQKPEPLREELNWFVEQILLQYGVSGPSGRRMIRKLANSGNTNPYLLFEAAGLELEEGENIGAGTESAFHCQRAFSYYQKAAESGHGLSEWSLGYLYQKFSEKKWPIDEIQKLGEEEQRRMALDHFHRAAKKNCYGAFCLLEAPDQEKDFLAQPEKRQEKGTSSFLKASKKQQILGRYSYAKTLEKELRALGENGGIPEEFQELAREMLDHYEWAAKMGYYPASYRCALYYGHFTDEKTIAKEKTGFWWIGEDEKAAIYFFKKVVKADTKDFMITVAKMRIVQYILDGQEGFSLKDLASAKSWITRWKQEIRTDEEQNEETQKKAALIRQWESLDFFR